MRKKNQTFRIREDVAELLQRFKDIGIDKTKIVEDAVLFYFDSGEAERRLLVDYPKKRKKPSNEADQG